MDKILWTSDNNIWKIGKAGQRFMIIGEGQSIFHTDYPVRWPTGQVAFDNPHAIPAYVQMKAEVLLDS
ncbi:MAG: hypothetical protein V3T23_01655 [Nitrososphaerales archaeon]